MAGFNASTHALYDGSGKGRPIERQVSPPQFAHEATLSVDLDALAANYRLIAARAAPAETAPVVKADAYGLGVGPVARRLWAEGARSFFIARLAEGEALRELLGAGRPATIYVLDGCPQAPLPCWRGPSSRPC